MYLDGLHYCLIKNIPAVVLSTPAWTSPWLLDNFNDIQTRYISYLYFEKREKYSTPLPFQFSSVQFSSVTQSCPTLCDAMNRSTPGLPVHHQLPEFTQTHVHRDCDAIQPPHPLLSPFPLPPIPPSIRVFSNESTLCMKWPKDWNFSFSITPSKEIPGLISFRMHWLDLLAVQRTLKSLLQHHISKASVLRRSAFFTCLVHL